MIVKAWARVPGFEAKVTGITVTTPFHIFAIEPMKVLMHTVLVHRLPPREEPAEGT